MTAPHDASCDDGPRHVLPMRESRRMPCLMDVLSSIAADVTADRRKRRLPEIAITLDVEGNREPAADADAIRAGLVPLVAAACEAAAGPAPPSDGPDLREVIITAVDTPRGIEIEVADSGPGPACIPQAALSAARGQAESHGGHLDVVACPEGGSAVTFCLPSRVHGLSIRPAA